jgi:hypothetical protein
MDWKHVKSRSRPKIMPTLLKEKMAEKATSEASSVESRIQSLPPAPAPQHICAVVTLEQRYGNYPNDLD